jgi:hypothetical protein
VFFEMTNARGLISAPSCRTQDSHFGIEHTALAVTSLMKALLSPIGAASAGAIPQPYC